MPHAYLHKSKCVNNVTLVKLRHAVKAAVFIFILFFLLNTAVCTIVKHLSMKDDEKRPDKKRLARIIQCTCRLSLFMQISENCFSFRNTTTSSLFSRFFLSKLNNVL